MKLNMPLVTLLTGAVLGVGVLVASMVAYSGTSSAPAPGETLAASPASTVTEVVPLPSSAPSSSATAAATAAATATSPATAAAAAAAATAASANQAGVPPQADYVAQVDGGGAAVAISVHGGKAVAYVCNGHAVAAWLRGTATGGKLDLTGKHGARLQVDYRDAKAAGSIMADGVRYTFLAPVVHRASSARRPPGLYEATAVVRGVKIKAGWIVLPGGGQVGSVEYDPESAVPPTAQAPVLDLATGTASYDGVTLVASLISGITGSGF